MALAARLFLALAVLVALAAHQMSATAVLAVALVMAVAVAVALVDIVGLAALVAITKAQTAMMLELGEHLGQVAVAAVVEVELDGLRIRNIKNDMDLFMAVVAGGLA